MAGGSSAKFPQTRAWVRGLREHLEEQTQEEWTYRRLADEADVEYGLLRRWATGLNEPKAGNQRKLSTFAHRFGYSASRNNVDSGHTTVEPAPMLSTVEIALIEHFRRLPGDRQAEVVVELKKEVSASSQRPAARPKA